MFKITLEFVTSELELNGPSEREVYLKKTDMEAESVNNQQQVLRCIKINKFDKVEDETRLNHKEQLRVSTG